jgi:3-dehydroquinate dehydratase
MSRILQVMSQMNQQEFVDAIKIAVRDSAASDTLKALQSPPGR